MNINKHQKILRSAQVLLITCLGVMNFPNSAQSQIIPDQTLKSESSNLVINGNQILIQNGAIRGQNLFHSFSQFNINNTEQVYFNNPTGINNILTRITSPNISNINGLLGVDGNANLFLINPYGIIFGKAAQLDIKGSFLATTATGIKLGDQGLFTAINPEESTLLTIKPSALLFNQINNSSSITNQGILQVPKGQNLVLVGGDIISDGGSLFAKSGNIEIGGLKRPGIVTLNDFSLSFPAEITRGNVSLSETEINVRNDGGGNIIINGQNIDLLAQTKIRGGIDTDLGTAETQGGNITIHAQESTNIQDGSFIANVINDNAQGQLGEININTGNFSLINNSRINSSSFGIGNAGNINIIAANNIILDGATIQSDVAENNIGNGGNIEINTGNLSLINGGQINSIIRGKGEGGNIKIQAKNNITFDGVGSNGLVSAVFSDIELGASGNAGNIEINTGNLSLINGGQIISISQGKGNAGNITIKAENNIIFDGVSSDGYTSAAFSDIYSEAVGNAGNINIETGNLSVLNGGALTSSTYGLGNAGNVKINARETVIFDGVSSDGYVSAAFSDVREGAIGNAGNIDINTDKLLLLNGAGLTSSTLGLGNAGKITITARNFQANSATITTETNTNGKAGDIDFYIGENFQLINSAIKANTTSTSTGDGGSIFIDPVLISLDNAQIAVNSQGIGKGGDITLISNILQLNKSSITAETASNQGGEITIENIGYLLLNNNSKITATAGTSNSLGDGGNIKINSPLIITLSNNANNQIIANAFTGKGGNIKIITDGIFGVKKLDISASSQFGVQGTIEIHTPGVEPASGLIELPTTTMDISALIQNSCKGVKKSAFTITGRGGLPIAPDTVLDIYEPLIDLGNNDTNNINKANNSEKNISSNSATILQEARGWSKDDQGRIILTAKPVQVTAQSSWLNSGFCAVK